MLKSPDALKYTTPLATATPLRTGAKKLGYVHNFCEASLFNATTAPVGGRKGGFDGMLQLTPFTKTTPSLTAPVAKRPSEPAQEGTAWYGAHHVASSRVE